MKKLPLQTLLSKEEIEARVKALGQAIVAQYAGVAEPIVLIGILKGSVIFLSDLARAIERPIELEFMGLSSYGNATESSGMVQITQDLTRPIKDRHVLVVEDIVDTGLTLRYLLHNLEARGPKSVRVCSLLEKPSKSHGTIPIDFLGFSIPDRFVVGYGLDYESLYRNLPYVGYLD